MTYEPVQIEPGPFWSIVILLLAIFGLARLMDDVRAWWKDRK